MHLITRGLAIVVCAFTFRTSDKIWDSSMSDQEKCQAEADFMIKYHKNYHVGPTIGKFEGIGYNINGTVPGTCTPSRSLTLTGDAIARDGNRVSRVRSWR